MLHYQWSGRATVDILPRKKKKKRSEVPITSLLGTAGSINRGLHMCFPRWVLECLLIARKCHPVTHKQIKKFIGAKVINYVWRIAQGFWKQYLQPPTQGGREPWRWGLLVLLASHTVRVIQSAFLKAPKPIYEMRLSRRCERILSCRLYLSL